LFQACLSGKLHSIPQRPGDKDRSDLIRSGSSIRKPRGGKITDISPRKISE
jgi:hypothetical protein